MFHSSKRKLKNLKVYTGKMRRMFMWFLILNFFSASLQSIYDEGEYEQGYMDYLMKRFVSPCFGANTYLEDIEAKINSEKLLSSLEILPIEIFHHISKLLSPLDVVRLTRTSKSIQEKLDNRFWEDYMRFHGQERWNYSIYNLHTGYSTQGGPIDQGLGVSISI